MKCDEIHDLMGMYWDLPDNDLRRKIVDDHIKMCGRCREEFLIWQESRELIQQEVPVHMEKPSTPPTKQNAHIADQVMNRIYKDESWKVPVSDRMYALSYKMRKNLTIIIAFCMALFIVSFLHSVFEQPAPSPSQTEEFTGLIPVAGAESSQGSQTAMYDAAQSMPVASINDPLVLHIGYVPSSPDYFLIFSILGMAVTMLIMNWFSRLKA